MLDNEGSVSFENDFNEDDIFEGDEGESTNEGQDEGQDSNINNNQNGEGDEGNQDGSQGGDQNQDSGKTDKGTNLANDPVSRANQLRANAEAQLRQAIAYIKHLEQSGGKQDEGKKDELFLDPSKIETREDLQKFADSLLKVVGQKNQELEGKLKQTDSERQFEQTKSRVLGGIQEVQSKYPVFREYNLDGTKNPSYDPELDKALADLYKELDFDQDSNFYRGKVNIMRLADTIMKTSKRGEANGSQNAQTKVIDKRQGAVSGGQPSNAKPDDSKLTVSGLFAQRVQQAVSNRNRR